MTTWLSSAVLSIKGRLPDSSNNALLCDAAGHHVVLKPVAGERPLWDFPDGTLARREKASSVLDRCLGWGLVPTTAWREHTDVGAAVVQEWIDGQPDVAAFPQVPAGWVAFAQVETRRGPATLAHRDDTATMRMIVFDMLANNADRKGGHLLRTAEGHLYGIDHGLTFHVEPKLRTVLWGLAGMAVPEQILDAVADADLHPVAEWIGPDEAEALEQRRRNLLRSRAFERPPTDRPPFPWPLI